ncbi:MAG: AAA family ATPase [Clostridia bacterium]|nr:AAA family ATPase [Clostridia bacterium]
MGTAVLIASGKGGTGKTTLAVNLGVTLAQKDAKVCLVDLNMGLRNLDIYMGLEDRALFDLGDVFTGVCKVEKALVRDDRFPHLYLLSCPQFKEISGVTPMHYKKLFAVLKKVFDYIIIDTPVSLGSVMECAAPAADSAVIVVTPDYTAVRNGDTMDQRLAGYGIRKRCYVVNKVSMDIMQQGSVPDLEYIADSMNTKMCGVIPFDENIHNGNNSGNPVVMARDSYIADNFVNMALRIF